MIIELAGPPCVGKTTFARALAGKLQSRGLTTNVVLSFRPRDMVTADAAGRKPIQATAAIYRVLRPIWETARATANTSREEWRMARMPASVLPPRTLFSSIRMQQYMLRLARSWRLASSSPGIAIFDQAFVQAVYSLALAARAFDSVQISRALDCLPHPDLLVRLTASKDILASRLAERQEGHGVLERLMETDPATNLASVGIFNRLDDALADKGFRITHIDTSDNGTMAASMDPLEHAVVSCMQRAEQRMSH